MKPVEWYYARDNQQHGPVSSVELKQLALAGQLRPEDLVWREGMTEWAPAQHVRGLFETETAPAAAHTATTAEAAVEPTAPTTEEKTPAAPAPTLPVSPAPRRHPLDPLVEWSRSRFDARLVDLVARFFRECGSYGLLVAMAAVAAYSIIIIFAVDADPATSLLRGGAVLIALGALQCVAGKFCNALEKLNESTAGRLSSPVFPNALAILSKALGVILLLTAIAAAVRSSEYILISLGAVQFITLAHVSLAALHPAKLGYSIGGESAKSDVGEEGLQAVTFAFKAVMRAVPVAFGAGVVCGTLFVVYACCASLAGAENARAAAAMSTLGTGGLIASALIPPAAYAAYLLYYLLYDLCRAILRIASQSDDS